MISRIDGLILLFVVEKNGPEPVHTLIIQSVLDNCDNWQQLIKEYVIFLHDDLTSLSIQDNTSLMIHETVEFVWLNNVSYLSWLCPKKVIRLFIYSMQTLKSHSARTLNLVCFPIDTSSITDNL